MEKGMKKRWISLYVENQVGVLSKISGLFAGKSYNLDSLTVGTTEDPTVSRMTIATVSDDETFEQIKANSSAAKEQEAITYKQPVSKRKIAKKFLLAMAGVAISSIILYLLLSLYNKIRAGFAGSQEIDTGKEPSLETPDNLIDAVKTFLDKTRWDN